MLVRSRHSCQCGVLQRCWSVESRQETAAFINPVHSRNQCGKFPDPASCFISFAGLVSLSSAAPNGFSGINITLKGLFPSFDASVYFMHILTAVLNCPNPSDVGKYKNVIWWLKAWLCRSTFHFSVDGRCYSSAFADLEKYITLRGNCW